MTKTIIDEQMANELALFIPNDYPTYQALEAVKKNLAKKLNKGIYKQELAEKVMYHVVVYAMKRYHAMGLNDSNKWCQLADVSTRKAVASELLANNLDEIQEIAEELKNK